MDLKAALFSKQREAAKEKVGTRDGDPLAATRKVSDKVGRVCLDRSGSTSLFWLVVWGRGRLGLKFQWHCDPCDQLMGICLGSYST